MADRAHTPMSAEQIDRAVANMREACICAHQNDLCVPCKTANLITRLSSALSAARAEREKVRAEAIEECAKLVETGARCAPPTGGDEMLEAIKAGTIVLLGKVAQAIRALTPAPPPPAEKGSGK